MHHRTIGRIAAVLFAVLTPSLATALHAAPPPQWPQTGTDLAADPSVTFGVLSNGMRYAIQHNATPKDQVSMRFVIAAGSMQEAHDQEGLAHLLEHMAFRGSAHVSSGEMIAALQRLGMRFGADINAETRPEATIYQFDLAHGDDASLDTGLHLLREIGGELTLDPTLLETERKVVLQELHGQPAPLVELFRRGSAVTHPNHPFGRSPRGRDEVLEHAPVQRLRDFYDAYYRPERAVLVIVGDIDPAAVEAKIKAQFANWKGRGKAGSDPAPEKVAKQAPRVELAVIPGIGAYQRIAYQFPHAPKAFAPGLAGETEWWTYVLATSVADLRLQRMVEHAGKPFGNGDAMSPAIVPAGVAGADISDAAQIADWRTSLALLVRLKRQIESEGLTQHEVDEALARQLALFDVSAVQSASERSPERVNDILGALRMEKTYRSPQQTNDLIKQIAKTLTADKVNAILRAHYKSDAPVLFFATNTQPEGGKAAVDAAFAAASSEPLVPFEAVAEKAWPYTDFGKPGVVVARRTDAATDVTMVRFANGVELNVKPTTFEANAVSFQLRFGYGQIGLPRDAVDGRSFGWAAVRLGGYRDLTEDEAERALADKKVGVFVGQNEDSYVMTWQPRPADTFDLQMQVLAATFSAPGWRTDDWKSYVAGVADGYASWDSSPASVFGYQSPVLLHGGDQRWMLKKDLITTVKQEDAVAFMKPIVANAPIEINVAGDITVEHAIEAVAKTLGALPPRSTAPEPKDLRIVHGPAPTVEPIVMHHTGPAYQALAVVAWPTTDMFADRVNTHATTVLASVIQDRAFNMLRNAEGKTYGPSVSSQFSQTLPGYGGLLAMAQVEPQDVPAVFAAFDSIAADIVAHGIGDDEFARAAKPHVETTERSRQRNDFWVRAMAHAQSDPRGLARAAVLVEEFKALTKADVEAAARKWLVKAKAWRAEVLPQAPTASVTPAPGPSSVPAH